MTGIKHRSITQDLRINPTKLKVDSLYIVYSKYVDNKFVHRYDNQLYYIISISKKIVKKAVQRNKIRRYIRQKFNILNSSLGMCNRLESEEFQRFKESKEFKEFQKLKEYRSVLQESDQLSGQAFLDKIDGEEEVKVLKRGLKKPLFMKIMILNKDVKSYISNLCCSIISCVNGAIN